MSFSTTISASAYIFAAGLFAFLSTIPLTPVVEAGESASKANDASERTNADGPLFPWVGEELYYSVRVNNSEAMRAVVRAGDIRRHQGRHYVAVNGIARSRGFFDAVYPVDDQANTFLDPETSFPIRSEKVFDENERFRTYDVDYHHTSYKAKVERIREDRESRFQKPIPADTHDMVTWLYDLRRVGDLSIGDEFSYYIYDGWLLSRVDLEVVEREDLLTPMGWFKTWKFDFSRQIMDAENADNDDENSNPQPPNVSVREAGRHTGSLWLSRDVNFLPVRVTIDTMLGPGEAVIIGYTPGEAR